jgi:hypothetical protein
MAGISALDNGEVAMDIWEALLVGVLALLALLWFGPGVKEAVRQSPAGSSQDWWGLLVPIGLVVGFVFLLIILAQ